jgi:Tfp pilus assembly protein PilN
MNARGTKELLLGGEPRVQLLPPIVREKERLRETQHFLVLLVILAGAVAFAGVVFGFFRAAQAQGALAAAHVRTEQILEQQQEYSEVAQISSFVRAGQDAQRLVTGNEFDWVDVINDLAAYLPEGALFNGISVNAPAPWEPPLIAEGPLRAERVGVATLEIASANYLSAALFAEAAKAYEGAADIAITQSLFQDGRYITTVVVTLNPSARSERFEPADEETQGEADQADASTSEGAGQ